MKKGRVIIAGIAAVFIAGVIIVRLMGGKEVQAADTPTVVETITPQIGDIRLYTSLLGKAEPEQSAVIHPEAGGTVLNVFVKAGDNVSAGQEICTIDTKQVENARNTMENAQVAYQEAQTALGRLLPLYQGASFPRRNMRKAPMRFKRQRSRCVRPQKSMNGNILTAMLRLLSAAGSRCVE